MIDVVLVNPRAINDQYPPMGLLALAAYVREQGISVKIIDAQAELLTDEEVCSRVQDAEALLCGFSFLTYQVSTVQTLLSKLKVACPSTCFVAGGIHASTLPEEVVAMGFDYVVVGEGEVTLTELIWHLKGYGNTNADIAGIWRPNGFKPRELIKNLDELPLPAWDLVPIERYRVSQPESRHTLEPGQSLTLSTSRGCLFNCVFCCWGKIYGRTHRYRSAAKVVDEIELIVYSFGVSKFFFVDDGILGDRQRAEDIASEIMRRGLKVTFSAAARVTDPGLNRETLTKLFNAGLRTIDLGVESGSSKILRLIRKGVTIEQVKHAHRLAHEVGLKTTSLMMVGHLEESWSDFVDSLALFVDMPTDYVNWNALTPYPGTEVFDVAKVSGWIRDFDFSRYHSDGWYRVMRNRCFTFEEINSLVQVGTGASDVMMKWHKKKPKTTFDYFKLLGSRYPLGLDAYGRFLVVRYLQTHDRSFLEALGLNHLKLKRTKRLMENRETADLVVSVRKRPSKLLFEPNRIKRLRIFLPVVAEYIWDNLRDLALRFRYAWKLQSNPNEMRGDRMKRYYMGNMEVKVIKKLSHNEWLVETRNKEGVFKACTANLWKNPRKKVIQLSKTEGERKH